MLHLIAAIGAALAAADRPLPVWPYNTSSGKLPVAWFGSNTSGAFQLLR